MTDTIMPQENPAQIPHFVMPPENPAQVPNKVMPPEQVA